MQFKSPSLPELHAFLAVCQLGSFRQAAGVLFVTQAAVSRAVQRLEQRLECTLLDRSGPRVLPTARGREFQVLVEAHVAGLETAVSQFGVRRAKRRLRVSVVPTLATRWLVPRLGQFRALHPDIEIELRPFHHDEDFTRDDVDLWIDVKRPSRAWPRGVRARYLLGREIQPACTPAVAARLRQPRDLLKATLLQHINFPGNWALWLQKAGGVDLPPTLGPGFDLGNNLIVAACAGMGVTVVQPLLIEAELGSGQLVLPFGPAVNTGRGYFLCSRAALAGNEDVVQFTAWLLEASKASSERLGFSPRGATARTTA
ncbi:LysR substrate-binding domain-containing protein [Acidovorax sp. LjRoot129]|uniref:LysR substrate-binding domain-containing protein n=1 Tax=Acidovorax sp. LjRoot129 TaxID=3342260 RepID=UPI003ED05B8D